MFIRPCYRKIKGKRQAYWALVESYRSERGPRQRTVAWLGKLKQSERAGIKRAAEGKKKSPYVQLQLFDQQDRLEPEWVEVDAANVRVENQLEFGGMWLGYEVFDGNRNDVTTWQEIVTTMEKRYGRANRIWCGDRGMMSRENMAFMESDNRRYIIGASKGTLKKFEREKHCSK
jgi:hypothetical protein